MRNNNESRNALNHRLNLLTTLGYTITKKSTILDFGCGKGLDLQELQNEGYQAYGCDIKVDSLNPESEMLLTNGFIRVIDSKDYKLPFADNTFDLIYSYQVLEHVKNHQMVISEIARILKPNGITYHHFPAKLRIIESHIKVPFASAISANWWLYFWAICGIRNKYQTNLSAKETVKWNKDYLKENTNYLSNRSVFKLFSTHFQNIVHCEKTFIYEILKDKKIPEFIGKNNLNAFIFRMFHAIVVVAENPKKG